MTTRDQNPIITRPATSADTARLSSLAHQLLLHERGLNEEMGELTRWAASPEELRKQMRRPNTQFFVAEKIGASGPEIIGYIKVVIHGRQPDRGEMGVARWQLRWQPRWLLRWLVDLIERAARGVFNFIFRRPRPNVELSADLAIGYIAGVFVRPEERRASVGRALTRAAEDWLRAQGVKTSDLHVLSANEAAWRFWEEAGYKPLTMGMRKKLE